MMFNIGDKVRIRKDLEKASENENLGITATNDMISIAGEDRNIVEIVEEDQNTFYILSDVYPAFWWTEKMFSVVPDEDLFE